MLIDLPRTKSTSINFSNLKIMRLIKKRTKLTHHHFIIFGILFLLSFLSIAQSCKEVIGYYPNWQWYDRAKLVNPQSIDYSKYTIINYSFFDVDTDGNIEITDPWADKNLLLGPINWSVAPAGYDTGYDFGNPAYHHPGQKFSDICHSHNVKLLPSIGGFTLSYNFSAIAADPVKRQTFANSCVDLIDAFGFDGIDIDWEYPGFADHNGTPQDKVNFTLFLQEIRTAIDNYGPSHGKTMILTAAVGANQMRMADVEWNNVSNILDAINLMSYDFFGTWDPLTNHNSPLHSPAQGDPAFNLSSAVDKLINFYNVDPNKINAGVAFYGRSAKTNGTPGLFSSSTGAADLITFSEDDGTPLYYNVLKKMHLFNDNWDATAKVPYLTGKNGLQTFVSYDNEESIGLKAQYIVDQNLRGAIIWEITGDYIETSPGSGIIAGTPLADTLNSVFCNYTSNNSSAPTITCPNTQALTATNGTNAVLPDYTTMATTTVNCTNSSNLTVTQSPIAGSTQNIGISVITLTATDDCGNSSSCNFNVNITDGSSLTWVNQPANASIECDESNLPPNTGVATVNSTCAFGNVLVTYIDSVSTGACLNSLRIIRTWQAEDGCNNTISYIQIITSEDNTAPELTCPSMQTLFANNGTDATLPDYSNLLTATDNCTSDNYIITTQVPPIGSVQNVGVHSVTFTATDQCGNVSNCNFDLEIFSTLDVNKTDKLKISIYPNPFEDNFSINFNQESEYKIIVRDAIGRLVEDIHFTGNTLTMYNYGHYASGTYFLKIISHNKEVQFHKIVKK
jgi:chitinase